MSDLIKVALPSKGVLYNGIDTINIRPFKGKEMKILAGISYDNFQDKCNDILAQTTEGIDILTLTEGDRLFLAIWQSRNSYGPSYSLKISCRACFHKFVLDIDLDKLETITLPEDFKEPYELDLSNKKIAVRLLRASDELKVSDYASKHQDSFMYRLALSVVSDKNILEVMAELDDMPAADVNKIRAFHKKFNHGLKLESEYKCPACGHKEVIEFPFDIGLWFPFGDELDRRYGDTI